MSYTDDNHGELTVYTGPMWAGKSTALINTLQTYDSFLAFTPETDDRTDGIQTHDQYHVDAAPVPDHNPDTIQSYATQQDPDVIGIDEAQFFADNLVDTVDTLRAQGYDVVVAGLDRDFRKEQFGPMPDLMDVADTVEQLYARCTVCDDDAAYTQRLIDGDPAPYDSPQVLTGEEIYEPRCDTHHELASMPEHRQSAAD